MISHTMTDREYICTELKNSFDTNCFDYIPTPALKQNSLHVPKKKNLT